MKIAKNNLLARKSVDALGTANRLFSFTRQGKPLNFEIRLITKDDFRALGISLKRFAPGLKLYVMSQEDYQQLSSSLGLEDSAAFYPLAENGDLQNVLEGKNPFLLDKSRAIAVPEDFNGKSNIVITHEILHDIFIGGGISIKEREDFVRSLISWVRHSKHPSLPHLQKNQEFYEEVGRICAQEHDISDISYFTSNRTLLFDRDFITFASECFAYAGEHLLLPAEARFSEVPRQMLSHLRNLRLREVNRQESANPSHSANLLLQVK